MSIKYLSYFYNSLRKRNNNGFIMIITGGFNDRGKGEVMFLVRSNQ